MNEVKAVARCHKIICMPRRGVRHNNSAVRYESNNTQSSQLRIRARLSMFSVVSLTLLLCE